MNVKFWKILGRLWIIDALRHVATARWGMRWLSLQWFDTLYRMSERTFLLSLIFLYNPALQGNCYTRGEKLRTNYAEEVKQITIMFLRFIWLQSVQGNSC
jgi:hypothetical protein